MSISPPRLVREILLLGLALALPCMPVSVHAQGAEALLERGLYTETAQGNPRAAIAIYERALRLRGLRSETEALLRLRLAIACDAVGDARRAREEFETVAGRFDEVESAARVARRYLGSVVREDPARFMPPDMLLYLELVNPGDELINLAEALRGTPFENPVDVLRSRGPSARTAPRQDSGTPEEPVENDARRDDTARERGDREAPQEDTPGNRSQPREPTAVDFIAATFNRAIFRELSKIGGLALGIPADAQGPGDLLGVASLGGSDVLAGLVTSVLTIQKPPRVGLVHGLPIYEFGKDDAGEVPLHLAFGGDLLVWGRPRKRVEAAIERYFSRSRSLATNPDFRAASTYRPDALLFAYVGPGWVSSWRKGLLDGGNRRTASLVDGLDQVLQFDALRPVAARIKSTALTDSLHAIFHVGTPTATGPDDVPAESTPRELLRDVSTPRLDSEILRSVPEDSIGFVALRLDRGVERWTTIRGALERLSAALGTGEGGVAASRKLDASLAWLRSRLETSPGSEILANLRSVVIGAVESPILAVFQNLYVILEFEEADAGEKMVRAALANIARRISKRPGGGDFHSETREVDGHSFTLNWLEPLSAVRPGYVRLGDQFVVSLAGSALRSAVGAYHRTGVAIQRAVPSGANKMLYLKPRSIVRMTSIGRQNDADPARLFFSHVERLLVYTRERPEGLSLELEVPQLTPTLRAVLNEAAKIIESRRPSASREATESGKNR